MQGMDNVTMDLICLNWMNRNKKPLNKEELLYFTNTVVLSKLPQY